MVEHFLCNCNYSVEANKWRGEVRRNFWSVRVVEPWNGLPESNKKQETINGFKNALDKFRGGPPDL